MRIYEHCYCAKFSSELDNHFFATILIAIITAWGQPGVADTESGHRLAVAGDEGLLSLLPSPVSFM